MGFREVDAFAEWRAIVGPVLCRTARGGALRAGREVRLSRRSQITSWTTLLPRSPQASLPVVGLSDRFPDSPDLLRRPQLRRPRQGNGPHRPRSALLLHEAGRRRAGGRGRPDGDMPYPTLTANLHHEVELVVAIGKGGSNIAAADALAAHLRLRRGLGHDTARFAKRHEKAGPPVVHWQGL